MDDELYQPEHISVTAYFILGQAKGIRLLAPFSLQEHLRDSVYSRSHTIARSGGPTRNDAIFHSRKIAPNRNSWILGLQMHPRQNQMDTVDTVDTVGTVQPVHTHDISHGGHSVHNVTL